MKKVSLILSVVVMTAMMLISFKSISQEVTIGTQVWMTKNLDVSTFRNGDSIPQAKTDEEWDKAGQDGKPAWCYYDNDPANSAKYGKLYNFFAVSDLRGLAPEGWKIPSDEDWNRLDDFLDHNGTTTPSGNKMKYTDFWADYEGESGNGTNESGFSGLPGGFRKVDNYFGVVFHGIGKEGGWWSSSERNAYLALIRHLDYSVGRVSRKGYYKNYGFSVRCLRDTAMMLISSKSISQEVTIGTQVWMTKNLDVSTFRNGDPIPQVKTATGWEKAIENQQPAWCYYDNDQANGEKYGKLYNWYAVNDPRGLAPVGHHIPTDEEWEVLTDYLGSWNEVGTKMKSKNGWVKNGNGTNESGFSGLPGGFRNKYGTFYDVGKTGYWWSSSEHILPRPYNFTGAWYRDLHYNLGSVSKDYDEKGIGYSVRCLRD